MSKDFLYIYLFDFYLIGGLEHGKTPEIADVIDDLPIENDDKKVYKAFLIRQNGQKSRSKEL